MQDLLYRKDMLPFRLLAGALALMLVWALLGSERRWVLSNRPMVVHLSNIKTTPEMRDLTGEMDSFGIHLRRQPGTVETLLMSWLKLRGYQPKPDSLVNMTDPAMGYSVREWGFFGMPFGYYTEFGPVLYVRNDWGTLYGPLNPAALARLNQANGRDVTRYTVYPFWSHLWGWLFVLGIGVAWWLWHRGENRYREEFGLI